MDPVAEAHLVNIRAKTEGLDDRITLPLVQDRILPLKDKIQTR